MTDPTICTLYKLHLTDEQDDQGHYEKMFTIHSVSVVISPAGETVFLGSLGYQTAYKDTGYTEYVILVDDVIMDQLDRYFTVSAVEEWAPYGELEFNRLVLERTKVFPFLAGLYGYYLSGDGGEGYASGYARLYMAI